MTDPRPSASLKRSRRGLILGVAIALILLGVVVFEIALTRPVRGAVRTYTDLISAANRRDLDAATRLCTSRYLKGHRLVVAPEGGIVGFPRNIHKNFQAWREGSEIRLCPTNRVGPVYRFVEEDGRWKFDGVIGRLMPFGEIVPMDDDEDDSP